MKYLAIVSFVILLVGCKEHSSDMSEFNKIYGKETADIQELFSKVTTLSVYFGHQSVGENILNGISILESDSDVKLNRYTGEGFEETKESVFFDFRIGENGNQISKIDDFVSFVKSIPEERNAIAILKLCYVDLSEGYDVNKIFSYYKDELLKLKNTSTNTRIILTTVPLTTVQRGWKAVVKKIIGRQPAFHIDNVNRLEFNERLLNELSEDFAIFDISLVESTLPDGKQSSFKYKGKRIPCLSELYTIDTGHLNDLGSKIVAYNLLAFLAELN